MISTVFCCSARFSFPPFSHKKYQMIYLDNARPPPPLSSSGRGIVEITFEFDDALEHVLPFFLFPLSEEDTGKHFFNPFSPPLFSQPDT